MINFDKGQNPLDICFLPDANAKPDIHPKATVRNSQIWGDVRVEEHVHIVNATIRADEGTPFYIAKGANIQDFAVLHAYVTQKNDITLEENLIYIKDKGYFAIYIDEYASISHGVLIHGPCYIGKNTFIGFKSTVDAANIGKNVEIGAHSYIKNVRIPDNLAIQPGAIITKPEHIEKYTTSIAGINERIVRVNLEMAFAYN